MAGSEITPHDQLEQEQWLLDGLATHPATWDFLGQQVFFADRDGDRNPNTCGGGDSWDGYRAQRGRISAGWVERGAQLGAADRRRAPALGR